MGFELFPKVESDYAKVTAKLPFGTAVQKTERVQQIMVAAAQQVAQENGGDNLVQGIFALINGNLAWAGISKIRIRCRRARPRCCIIR